MVNQPQTLPEKDDIELEFSNKYTKEHAVRYFNKHQQGLGRRFSTWREIQLARKALKTAGNPQSVLDLPCGAGRFWELLTEDPHRTLYAADNSEHMVEVAKTLQPPAIATRFDAFQSSAFNIKLEDNAVDCIFCIRLLHHIGEHEHRLAILKEFHRVTKDTVILSLWVDGNFKAWRRGKSEATGSHVQNNRFLIPRATIEAEFKEAGFSIVNYHDFLPKYAMWRVYVLRKNKH